MAPKPRPVVRRTSVTGPGAVKVTPASTTGPVNPGKPLASMLPPPVPVPAQGVLEREVRALETVLQNATVKTANLYAFHADAQRLGVSRYVPHPPRSLVQSLGEEIEKYDQLCDAIEAQLQRAIATLQRDLDRAEQRLRKEEEEAALATAAVLAAAPRTPRASPTLSRINLPAQSPTFGSANVTPLGLGPLASPAMAMSPTSMPGTIALTGAGSGMSSGSGQLSPTTSALGSGTSLSRRGSIALGPLRRNMNMQALKIQLPQSTLQFGPGGLASTSGASGASGASQQGGLEGAASIDVEELTRGLRSPVTLAPKSARPLNAEELPPDLISLMAQAQAQTQPTQAQVQSQGLASTSGSVGSLGSLGASMASLSGSSMSNMNMDTIDLTLDDGSSSVMSMANSVSGPDMQLLQIDGLGGSADKPIELDFDMGDMDSMTDMGGMSGLENLGNVNNMDAMDMSMPDLFGDDSGGDSADAGRMEQQGRTITSSGADTLIPLPSVFGTAKIGGAHAHAQAQAQAEGGLSTSQAMGTPFSSSLSALGLGMGTPSPASLLNAMDPTQIRMDANAGKPSYDFNQNMSTMNAMNTSLGEMGGMMNMNNMGGMPSMDFGGMSMSGFPDFSAETESEDLARSINLDDMLSSMGTGMEAGSSAGAGASNSAAGTSS